MGVQGVLNSFPYHCLARVADGIAVKEGVGSRVPVRVARCIFLELPVGLRQSSFFNSLEVRAAPSVVL